MVYPADFEKALQVGRPPNISKLFPNSKALIVSGKVIDRAMIAKGKAPGLDPSAHPPGRESLEVRMASIGALLINAVRPWPYTPVSLPRREFMEKSKAIWEELGLPALKPRMPWYGYSLGAWSQEDEQEAELAIKGDYFVTGEKQTKQRVKE